MLLIAILIYFGYKNYTIATRKGVNGWVWAAITVVAYFFAAILGSFFVVIFYLKNKIDFNLWVNDPDYSQHASQIIAQEFNSNVILGMAIYMFGVGGWLLVRYLLERKPDVIDDSFL